MSKAEDDHLSVTPGTFRATLENEKRLQSPDPKKDPSKVLPWIETEICKLEGSFMRDYYEEGAERYRLSKRKLTYPAIAEALLQAWADQIDGEAFIGSFCDWAWNTICQKEPFLGRSTRVELFLKEFLGGQAFGLATAVEVEGLSGSQMLVPLLKTFIAKLACEEHHRGLNEGQVKRLQGFIAYLLDCIVASIISGRKKKAQEAEVREIKEEILSRAPWRSKKKGSQ